MELKLIGNPKDENVKTLFKISLKEYDSSSWLRGWLKLAGVDLNNPIKKSSRFVYYEVNGDYLNGKKKKK